MYKGVSDLICGEIKRLREELVAESRRTAAEKLRADQMTEQHRMQAKLHQDAAQEVLRLRSRIDESAIRMPTWEDLHSAWLLTGADLMGMDWEQFVKAAHMVNDGRTATHRFIVRSAAELGRSMP